MTNAEFTILLARQRSGTHPLRDVLGGHPDIFCTPEVFHDDPRIESDVPLAEKVNFFSFLERDAAAYVARAASPERQEAAFLAFLRYLDGLSECSHTVVDVKYNSTHHFDGPWREIPAAPAMFGLVKRHGLRVLHLTRSNHLRYYLSLAKARRTGAWFDEAPPPDASVEIDVAEMLAWLHVCEAEDAVVNRVLGRNDRCFTIEYVDLFPEPDGLPAAEPLRSIGEWLSVDPKRFPREPRHRKQSALPLTEAVANYGEVEGALRGTPFERFLEDEPAYLRQNG